jgi:hypothetical protein
MVADHEAGFEGLLQLFPIELRVAFDLNRSQIERFHKFEYTPPDRSHANQGHPLIVDARSMGGIPAPLERIRDAQ